MSDMIATIEKNAREEIRIQWAEYKGKRFLDLRVFYLNDEDEMVPSKKGITLKPEQVPQLAETLAGIAEGEPRR